MAAQSHQVVGKIEGETSTDSFHVVVCKEDVGKNDYVEVIHEGKTYLLMIKEVKRTGDKSVGECLIIGMPPKTPFAPDSEVYLASEEGVRKCLGLETKESEGIYIGKLKTMDFNIWLPIKKLTRLFIVGKPGAGKSYTMGVMAEELIKKGIPVVIIDAHGEYSSLKVPAESPSEEFHVAPHSYSEQIIEFADMVFNPGADIDISSLENTRPEDVVSQMQCTIINLRGLGSSEQYSIVLKLLNKLLEAVMVMQIPPFYLVLDEAHLFAGRAKRDDQYTKQTLEVVRRFAQEGRKFGANLIVLTQRPQLLDMTVRSLSATWIIHKLTDPNDVRIAVESGGLGKEWEYDISWLESGNAIITGDVVERIPLVVKIRQRETTHGAPGFNPLDFVSPEERDKMRKRMAQLKDRLIKMRSTPGALPALPPSLPSLYMPAIVDEKALLDILKENKSLDSIDVLKSDLRYMPAIFCEVSVISQRRSPEIEFKERLIRLVPIDSSVSIVDWRHEYAYRLEAKEVFGHPPAPSPSREGKHEVTSPLLLDASSVESLKGPLKTFTASKLTQTIYFHREMGIYSKPGEPMEVFKLRLKVHADAMKANKVSQIRAEYAEKTQVIRTRINSLKEEIASIEKLVDGVKGELKTIERERAKVQREGHSTLKLASQIQTRESRLLRLERRMVELKESINGFRKTENSLEISMRNDNTKAGAELDALISAPLQNIVFQPKVEEVDVEALQLIWIPVIEALYRASFQGITKDFRLEWNAVNGRGTFGSCSECGITIDSLEGGLFCYTCGEMYCNDHLKACSVCGRSTCSEHMWVCPGCGNIFCIDEKPKTCAVCGKKICGDCAVSCIKCTDKVYCKDHVKICGTCKNTYCSEHYDAHVAYCKACGREICLVEQAKCSICGSIFCEDHVVKCAKCGEEVCKDDAWLCSACGKILCKKESPFICKICERPFCESCVTVCSICGAHVCKEHTKICASCGKPACADCLVEQKKLGGIIRKIVCRACADK